MADMSQAPEAFTQATAADSSAPVKNTTPVYEVGYHVVPTVGDDGVAAVVDKLRKILGDVETIAESFPAKMTLAYQIERATQGKREKYTEAYFGWIKFATDRERLPAIQEGLRAERDILRYLVMSTTREDLSALPKRAVFSSDRLEGETIAAPKREVEKAGTVSEADLDKSLEALTG